VPEERSPSSPAAVLAFIAPLVALGGTALAATATIVHISDPTTPANVAHVAATGALKTAGAVNGVVCETPPRLPWFSKIYLSTADRASLRATATPQPAPAPGRGAPDTGTAASSCAIVSARPCDSGLRVHFRPTQITTPQSRNAPVAA
jgi:hypothetical protein